MEVNPPKPGTPQYKEREQAFHAQSRQMPGCGDRPQQAAPAGDHFTRPAAAGPDTGTDNQARIRPGALLMTPEAVEILVQRRPICDGCPHYNGLCLLGFPAARDRCQEWKDRMAPAWLTWLTNPPSRCPAGLWGPRQARLDASVEADA